MLEVIASRAEVQACQRQFQNRLKALLKPKGRHTFGYQAGNFEARVWSDGQIWFVTGRLPERETPCHWNCFGTDLWPDGSNSIVVETNIPLSGISRRVSALFAKDPATGDVFLLHRGRIGGGKKGIGRDALTRWYRGEEVRIGEGDGGVGTAILVTALSGPSFLDDLTYFIRKVAQFKKLVAMGGKRAVASLPNAIEGFSFKPEFAGVKRGKRPSAFVAECNHGRIVDALEAHLRQKYREKGVRIFNQKPIDLGIAEGKNVVAIYEVKTDTDTQTTYTAIGQLLFHSALYPTIPKMTLVLPRTPVENQRLSSVLERLCITLLPYEMVRQKIDFGAI